MHLAFLCPFSHGPARGNLTTVNRIARSLQKCGCRVTRVPLDKPELPVLLDKLLADPPDLLHAFHAFHAGPLARQAAKATGRPYIVTLTGSDIFDPALRDHEETRAAIRDAAAVTCFDKLVAEQAATAFSHPLDKITTISQGVERFPDSAPVIRPPDAFIILLPAALRPVKGVDDAITQLTPLAADQPQLQLWIAGGVLDAAYADQIKQMTEGRNWLRLLYEVPYLQMGAYYQAADLVLNSSWFEGGMANALLEAMVMGRPVLARDVPGNRSLVINGKTGWLYTDGEGLRNQLRLLLKQPAQRLQIGRAAQEFVRLSFSPEREAAALRALYEKILAPYQRT